MIPGSFIEAASQLGTRHSALFYRGGGAAPTMCSFFTIPLHSALISPSLATRPFLSDTHYGY